MKGLPRDALLKLQSATEKIRNVCILAHVDHGKTTLADCLVTVNGIISERLAGRLRYLDSLPDEEERGITMKSSAITLYYCCDDSSYLVNLIDTPGHVDFSGEVSTAVRLCDGAVIVVDVVEGVCSQTKLLLRQAWKEHIKAVLLLNKVDRLALELQLTPADAYRHLQGVVEQVNAVMGEIFISERIQEHDVQPSTSDKEETGQPSLDSLEESFYFDPTKGNVLFGSAYDGWGFDLETFAEIYAKKAGVNPRNLTKALWGDFYLNSKERSIKTGARKHGKKPLFVQLVLENLWHLYNTVVQRQDKEATIKLASSLHVDLTPRDQRTCDGRQLLQVVMSRWLPLCRTVLNAICKHLPNPKQMPTVKVRRLICPTMSADPGAFDSLPQSTKALEAAFQSCDSKATDVIAFVSKMFPVDPASIPENKRADMTEEERRVRRQKALQQLAGETVAEDSSTGESAKRGNVESVNSPPEPPEFIAFARVYSGEIRKGQSLYVLPPTHDPRKVNDPKDVAKIEISRLYLLMGREIESVDSVPAGNVCGIGGLQDFVLKSATLSTTLACSAFSSIEFLSDPIVRVAIEPMNPLDMPALVTGLKLLNQADPCIQTFIQETGEHVIVAAGEVHLERCVKDLQERYSQIEISVSEPIIPFLETVVDPPSLPADSEVVAPVPVKKERTALVSTANKAVQISIRAYPIPPEAVNVLSANASILNSGFYGEKSRNPLDRRTYSGTAVREPQDGPSRSVSVEDRTRIFKFKESLSESLKGSPLELLVDKLLCFGPKRAQYNMLLNASAVPQFVQSWFDHAAGDCPEVKGNEAEEQFAKDFALSAVHGFHISCLAGPICHEPLRAVAFVIQSVKVLQSPQTLLEARNELDVPSGEGDEVGRKSGTSDGGGSSTANTSRSQGPISGQLIAAMKDGCLKAFQLGEQRLVEAMYSCFIHAPIDMLGKVYSVLGRRRGRVVGEEMLESSNLFQIKAILPVVESFGFAEEIRKKTSGHAWPQLSFSHWEAMDVDPFWKPSTEEEIMDYTSNFENVARRHMNAVRRRKGLATDEQVVVAAEKQRTLGKNV